MVTKPNEQKDGPQIAQIDSDLLKHLSPEKREQVSEWLENIETAVILISLCASGHLKINGVVSGEPTFGITDAGKDSVRQLLPEDLRQSAQSADDPSGGAK